MGRPIIDLTGQVFGRLTVQNIAPERSPDAKARWLCRCSCGTDKVFCGTVLRRGHAKSCGCLKADVLRYKGRRGSVGLACPFSRARLEEKYLNGEALYLIGQSVNVGPQTVKRWLQEFEIPVRSMQIVCRLTARKYRIKFAEMGLRGNIVRSHLAAAGKLDTSFLRTPMARRKRLKSFLTNVAARRAKQQADREQSEAIERSLNGDTFK